MKAVVAAGSPPAAAPGSTRYFVLLYCAREHRHALATLLAVTDEIGSGLAPQVDHAVAHARLEWWRQEARRFGRGESEHPWLSAWLRSEPSARLLELESLTEAAALDLASARLAGSRAWGLSGALFVLAARVLGVSAPTVELERCLSELGQRTAELEQIATRPLVATPEQAPPTPATAQPPPRRGISVPPAVQPQIAPLLVWSALAQRKAQRRARRPIVGAANARVRFDLLTDNLLAWSAARRALRGRYRLDPDASIDTE